MPPGVGVRRVCHDGCLLGRHRLRLRNHRADGATATGEAHGFRGREGFGRLPFERAIHNVFPHGCGQVSAVNIGTVLANQRFTAVGAGPHCGGELRGGADHPGVLVLASVAQLGGAGFRGGGATGKVIAARPPGDRSHSFEHVGGYLFC